MPRQKKVSFNQKLASYDVLIEDTSVNSDYFKVSQFPEGFTGGKNGFLLAGTPFLAPNSRILVEVVNLENQTIYYESVKDYTEGNSKLISFEVYENTPPGIYKVILLGQARTFVNGTPVPQSWVEKYNIRWTRDVIVEPRRRNISPIRFKNPPRIFIEQEKIIYTPSSSFITEVDNSVNISLTPRYKSTLNDGYTITLVSGSNFTNKYLNGVVTGSITASVAGKNYTTEVNLPLHKVINETHAETTSSLVTLDGIVDTFFLKSGSYQYTSPQTGKTYQVTSSVGIEYSYVELDEDNILDTGSYSRLRIVNLGTITGEVYKTEISYKVAGTSAEYVLATTPNISVPELLITSSNIGDEYWIGTFISGGLNGVHANQNSWYARSMPASNTTEGYELLANQVPSQYYTASSAFNLLLDSSNIMNGIYADAPGTGTSVSPYVFGTKDSYTVFGSSEYTLRFAALFSAYSGSTLLNNYENSEVYVYLAPTNENRILDNNPLGQLLTKLTINSNTEKQYFDNITVNFNPKVLDFGKVSLRFIVTNGVWQFSNISIKPAEEFAFNPDETVMLVPNYIDEKTINYKARFFDINGNSTKLEIESSPISFTGPRKYVKRSGDDMYGELYINQVPIKQQTLESSFTGLLSGGVITINPTDNTKYDISAGQGYIVDNFTTPLQPTYQLVTWSKFEGITPSGLNIYPRTNIAISASGEIYEQPNAFNDRDYRDYIVLGRVAHVGTPFIQRVLSLPLTVYNRHFHWFDLASAISPLNIIGNVYSPSGSSMRISKTSGETYRIGSNYRIDPSFPDITTDSTVTTVTFAYRWRSGSGYAEAPSTTFVTGSLYDNGTGILGSVANNRFTVQRIYFFGATNTTRIQFGQHLYNSMAEAIAASNSEVFNVDPNLSADATLRAFMIVKGDATNLSNPTEATFIPVSQFGSSGGGTGGGGVSSLAALSDVNLNSLINNDILAYDVSSGDWINRQVAAILPSGVVSASSQVSHNSTTGYVANEHINHTSVLINAGSGLTGGGDISATRTLTLDTGSSHFTSGVKSKMNSDGVYSSSAQLVVSAYTNAADNRVLTSTGTGGINAESNLTFDGSVLRVTGSVGIGIAPVTKLQVNDGTDRNFLVTSDATQQGTAGIAIGSFNDAANAYGILSIVSSKTIFNSNVGIGTTSPNRTLQIGSVTPDVANSDLNASLVVAGGIILRGNDWLNFDHGYAVHGRMRYDSTAAAAETALKLDSYYGFDFQTRGAGSKMVILGNSGNVGIGTTSPLSLLHVKGNAIIGNNDSNNGAILQLRGYANSFKNWQIDVGMTGGNFNITPSTTNGGTTFTTAALSMDTNGSVGINATPSISHQLIVKGTTTDNTRNAFLIRDSADAAIAAFRNDKLIDLYGNTNIVGNLAVDTDTLFVDAANNRVGIGTTSPTGILHVANSVTDGAVQVLFDNTHHSTSLNHTVQHAFRFRRDGGQQLSGAIILAGKEGTWAGAGSETKGYLAFLTRPDFSTEPTEKMRITSAGNVGIGTTSPKNYSGYNTLMIGNSTNNGGVLAFRSSYNSGDGAEIYQNTSGTLFVNTNSSTTAMAITAAGNVGIGTTSPAVKLEVSDANVMIRASGTAGTVPQLQLSSAGVVNWSLRSNAGGASDFTIYQDSTERIRINSSGNLGINSIGANAKLEVVATTGEVFRADAASGALRIVANQTEVLIGGNLNVDSGTLFVDSVNNRVGVGTVNPVGGLDVRSSGYIGSDANNSLFIDSTSSLVTIGAAGRSSFSTSALRFLTSDGTASLERARIDASGNLAVDTNTLFVDAVNNRVGVGTATPTAALDVTGASAIGSTVSSQVAVFGANNTTDKYITVKNSGGDLYLGSSGTSTYLWNVANTPLQFFTNNAERARIDASGNLGLGVTPSANDQGNALFLASGREIIWSGPSGYLSANATYAVGADRYIVSGFASSYIQSNGTHIWRTAPSGTAGAAISFTQDMTLSGGNLSLLSGRFIVSNATSNAGTTDISLGAYVGGAWLNTPSATQGWLAVNGAGVYRWASDSHIWYMGGTERARITSAGNFGIGTTGPTTPLEVSGGAGGTGGWNRTATLTATYPTLIFNSNSTRWGGIAYDHSAAMRFWVNATSNDIFATAAAMSILNNGNVGIGTTSPTAKLQVGDASSLTNYQGAPVGVIIPDGGGSWIELAENTTAGTSFRISHDGASETIMMNANVRAIGFRAAGYSTTLADAQMILTTTGNVGIGTTSPSTRLSVNGNTNINGDLTAITKSFLINHPTKPNHKLRYGSLESPYHGIRLTGDGVLNNGVCEIQLPDYISALVKENEVSIQLTNYQHNKNIWVETIDIENNKFIVKTKKSWFSKKQYKFFWSFTAIRKDVSDMEVEFEVQGDK